MIVQTEIEFILGEQFQPAHLQVENESHMHSVPPNSETHFKVVIVTDAFEGKRKVARHQQVYGALAAQLEGPVHALALHTYTAAEWTEREGAPASPDCLGGSKAEAQ
ncbi:transcriptional regulator BolA [Halioglobus sp. HI00S01]|uniref:BolA family protein n=1 Tax=Halioglobus sp. HI00S01 TaxID=1822214 RepID=UPI0007C3DF85|nr:BolA/IbaG family iron-sulfur metabolism protein [Halioglobus sp. HI00S01]KZX60360.1 transcriptional regulator BolA [Halioglobus sp. HI00S01]